MTTAIVAIHGHGLKPSRDALGSLWHDALRHGVERFEKAQVDTFQAAHWEFVYFGDLLESYLNGRGHTHDEALDIEDRNYSLRQLKARKRKSFVSRRIYERLPGKSSVGEFIADVGQPMMRGIGLGDVLIERFAPSYSGYWTALRDEVVGRVIESLKAPMTRGDRIVIVAHCLGSVAAYDALWRLQHASGYDWYQDTKVDHLVTLGSPLGDESVKKQLLGAQDPVPERYPHNVLHWANVTAEDDYISHDNTVANDYSAMLTNRLVSTISDESILNLAVRYGRSNPHNALGYLISPTVARIVCGALAPH